MPLLLTALDLDKIRARREEILAAYAAEDGPTAAEIGAILHDIELMLADIVELRYRTTGAKMMLDGRAHATAADLPADTPATAI